MGNEFHFRNWVLFPSSILIYTGHAVIYEEDGKKTDGDELGWI
jgi:hypothetical protein